MDNPNDFGSYSSLEAIISEVCRRKHLIRQSFGRYMSTETGTYYTKQQLISKYIEEINGRYYLKSCYAY